MIDVHCHLEQKDYDKDRYEVVEKCKEKLKAIITSSPYLPHFKIALDLHRKYPDFVYIALGLHPIYIKELKESEIEKAISFIKEYKQEIVAVGEVGLDYFHVKEEKWREKQKGLFKRFIDLSYELDLPLVVHCRDSFEDTIDILEQKKAKKVLMHLFGDKKTLQRVLANGWNISIGPLVARSKDIKKIVRDTPLDKIMLETDSPWFGFGERGTPLNVVKAAEKIAEVKKISLEEVEKQTDLNAQRFFNLNIK